MRRLPALTLACLLALVAPTAFADPGDPDPGGPGGPGGRDGVPQTSDGVQGEIVSPESGSARPRRTTVLRRWRVAPGVRAKSWREAGGRGAVRGHMLRIVWRNPRVRVDYANAGPVSRTAPLTRMLARDRAVAGINGDFFDIGDTGAPLGTGRDRQRGLLNGRFRGWNSAFYVDRQGRPRIGRVTVRTKISTRPRLKVHHVNSPRLLANKVGVYTPEWGRTLTPRVVDGQRKRVRMVRVRRGRVVRNTTKFHGPVRTGGKILVGRGKGARALVHLRGGTRVRVRTRVWGAPRMAITGNRFLVRNGRVVVSDDRELHPRTAIGVDRDHNRIVMLVVDGRSKSSRGYTMVELAEKMIDLGAEDALNLDGGGSSTMLAKRRGRVRVVNSPSDGSQRPVPNGIGITYRR